MLGEQLLDAAPLPEDLLLTGMSGVGKSTIAERLSELGYKVVDADCGRYSVVDERGEQHWDVDRIRDLLAIEDVDVLFVVGSDDAQVLFYPDFDHIVLLSAPRDVMLERLASRTNNPFGKSPEDLAKILDDLEKYEPMMRRSATHEVDTSRPLDVVIDAILSVARPARDESRADQAEGERTSRSWEADDEPS